MQRKLLHLHQDKQQAIEYFDGLLILACRVNRFAHYYQAALIQKTLELSGEKPSELDNELTTAKGCEKHYECGVLVAQHYAVVIGNQAILQGTNISKFPSTSEILEALSLDCIMHAALCLPNNLEKGLDLLADSISANNLALQGAIHLDNFFNRKAERAKNGKAGARKRHEKMNELKTWTIHKYKAGTWRSANQAAFDLASEVLEQSQKIGANLTQSNAQRTIAEWIRKSG